MLCKNYHLLALEIRISLDKDRTQSQRRRIATNCTTTTGKISQQLMVFAISSRFDSRFAFTLFEDGITITFTTQQGPVRLLHALSNVCLRGTTRLHQNETCSGKGSRLPLSRTRCPCPSVCAREAVDRGRGGCFRSGTRRIVPTTRFSSLSDPDWKRRCRTELWHLPFGPMH